MDEAVYKAIETSIETLKKGLAILKEKDYPPKTISSRENLINKLEFAFSEMDLQNLHYKAKLNEWEQKYKDLHDKTEKLIALVVLTRAFDPEIVFWDKTGAIMKLYNQMRGRNNGFADRLDNRKTHYALIYQNFVSSIEKLQENAGFTDEKILSYKNKNN